MISLSICQFCFYPFSSTGVTHYEEAGNIDRIGWSEKRLKEPLKPEQISVRILDRSCSHCGAKYHIECKVVNGPIREGFSKNLPSRDVKIEEEEDGNQSGTRSAR